jgi:Trk-type K+ transport system membrane component
MNPVKRPISITILACVYILTGAVGFVYHLRNFSLAATFPNDSILVEFVRLLAIVAGAFLLRGHNWARWLALAWIAFHVVISALNSLPQAAMHSVFCALFAWILFRRDATLYFQPPTPEAPPQ